MIRKYGGIPWILLFSLLISPAWGGSGRKPPDLNVRFLYESGNEPLQSPSTNEESAQSSENAGKANPEETSVKGLPGKIIGQLQRKNYLALGIGVVLFFILIGFLWVRHVRNREEEEEW